MTDDPNFVFTASFAAFIARVEEADPGMFEEIRRRARGAVVRGGRLVRGARRQCAQRRDVCAEAALPAQRLFREKFGVAATAGCWPDRQALHIARCAEAKTILLSDDTGGVWEIRLLEDEKLPAPGVARANRVPY